MKIPYLQPNISERSLFITTFVASLTFSWIALLTDNMINHDGIWYINTAKVTLEEGPIEAFDTFYWPFYSFLVAGIHKISGVPLEQTANLLNALFAAITCVVFIKIYKETDEKSNLLVVASILILAFTGMNKYRNDIMRDFGYWCFFLAGTLSLLRYFKQPQWSSALGWQVFSLAAFLFRIEGIILVLFGPFVMLLSSGQLGKRLARIAPLFSLFATGSIIALLAIDGSVIQFIQGKAGSYIDYFTLTKLSDLFSDHVRKIGQIYFYDGWNLSKYYTTLSITLLFSMAGYLFVKITACAGIPYTATLIYGAARRRLPDQPETRFVLFFVALLLASLFFYLLQKPAISPRYTTTLVFFLLILITHTINSSLPDLAKHKYGKRIILIVIIYLFAQTADDLISKPNKSKDYIKEAGHWAMSSVDNTHPIYSNSEKILYYTGRTRIGEYVLPMQGEKAPDGTIYNFDEFVGSMNPAIQKSPLFIIFDVREHERDLHANTLETLEAIGSPTLEKEYGNEKGDKAVIYRLTAEP